MNVSYGQHMNGKMQMKWLFILLLAVTAACSDKNSVPDRVLSPTEMKNVLWDMILADKYAVLYLSKDSSLDTKTERLKLYEKVFELHQTTRQEFFESYRFYISRPDITRVMFDSLSAMANRKREDLYKMDADMDKE